MELKIGGENAGSSQPVTLVQIIAAKALSELMKQLTEKLAKHHVGNDVLQLKLYGVVLGK